MKNRLDKLLSVKSIVTIVMTLCMAGLLFSGVDPSKEVLAVYCTSYGAIITYFFTRQDSGNNKQ